MLRNYLSAGVFLLGATFFLQPSVAGPLTSAEITKIINRVAVIDPAAGEHPAIIREVIKDDLGLQTGAKSRSELLFQDNTLTRLGAETFFSFKTGTRDMTLEKGSMLLQVPKGLGGAKIHTAAVTAAITGTTIMMEYIPGKYIKVLVLEGSLRLSRNGIFGDSLVLRPGKMVIMKPDAKKIPEPVDVDLKKIAKTSTLVNFPDSAPLPSMGLIQAAIDVQTSSIAKGNLAPTNLVMGHGTDVILASNDQLARIGATGAADVNSISNGGTLPAPAASLPPAEPVTGSTGTLPVSVTGATTSLPTGSLTDNTTSIVATVTDSAASLPGSLTKDTTSLVGSLTGSTTSVVGTVATDTTAILGALTAPVTPLVGVVTGTTTSLLAPITGSTASLPLLGSVVATTTSVLSSVTTSAVPISIVGSVTQATAPILSSLTSPVPIVGAVTATAPTQTVAPPTVSVSSSTQLLTLLSTTAPSPGSGTVVVSPTTVRSGTVTGAPPPSPPSSPVNSSPTSSVTATLPSTPTILATAPVSSTGITKPLRIGLGH